LLKLIFAHAKFQQFALVHEEMTLREQIAALKQTMSDENLELIPDYESRVDLLKELRFVDPVNATVSLKGRVACEVTIASSSLFVPCHNHI